MRTIAWTRRFGKARVFCLESGHDHQTFVDPNYRQAVARGIQWTAGRI
jgi:type 1 glutamine amidotransferase